MKAQCFKIPGKSKIFKHCAESSEVFFGDTKKKNRILKITIIVMIQFVYTKKKGFFSVFCRFSKSLHKNGKGKKTMDKFLGKRFTRVSR